MAEQHRIVYTNIVDTMRHMLVVGMVAMFAVMGYYIWQYNTVKPSAITPAPVKTVSDADVIVHGVELVEYVHERTLWNLWADEASIYSATKKTYLQDVSADFFDTAGVKSLHVISDTGEKDDLSGDITASGNVEADAIAEGVHLKTDELHYNAETQLITSETHVLLIRDNVITEGEGLKSDMHLSNVRILRDVKTALTLPDPLAPPVTIAADALQLDNGTRIATYTGHVVVVQEETEIRADLMRVFLRTTGSGESSADSIERIEVFGDVHVSQAEMMATGEKGEYTAATQMVVLTGTPEKQAYAEDRAANRSMQADLIRVYLETNDFEGDGNVKFSGLSGELPNFAPEP